MSEKNTDWALTVFWDCKESQAKMWRINTLQEIGLAQSLSF